MLAFSNTEKGNRTRFFKIKVLSKTCYMSIDEEVSKSFESAGIPLELYKQEKPEEVKDPDIRPVENPDSNKGSEDTPRTPETEESETEKKDKDGERKKKEHEDLRRAQEEGGASGQDLKDQAACAELDETACQRHFFWCPGRNKSGEQYTKDCKDQTNQSGSFNAI